MWQRVICVGLVVLFLSMLLLICVISGIVKWWTKLYIQTVYTASQTFVYWKRHVAICCCCYNSLATVGQLHCRQQFHAGGSTPARILPPSTPDSVRSAVVLISDASSVHIQRAHVLLNCSPYNQYVFIFFFSFVLWQILRNNTLTNKTTETSTL